MSRVGTVKFLHAVKSVGWRRISELDLNTTLFLLSESSVCDGPKRCESVLCEKTLKGSLCRLDASALEFWLVQRSGRDGGVALGLVATGLGSVSSRLSRFGMAQQRKNATKDDAQRSTKTNRKTKGAIYMVGLQGFCENCNSIDVCMYDNILQGC